jgi:hypothetical protein
LGAMLRPKSPRQIKPAQKCADFESFESMGPATNLGHTDVRP